MESHGIPVGTVTGIINGTGSMTAALGLWLIGPLQARYGWEGVWYFLIASAFAGITLISPKLHKEIYQHDIDYDRVSMRREATSNGAEMPSDVQNSQYYQYQYPGYRYGALPCDCDSL